MDTLSNIFENIIKEFEIEGDIDYEMFERYGDYALSVLRKFLYENNEDYTLNVAWRVIPFPRLKKIWEDWAKFGFVRDEKGLSMICDIMESNTLKVSVLTMLAGHTSTSPDDYYENAWGDYISKLIKQYYRDIATSDETHHSKDPDQLEFNWGQEDGKRKEIEKEGDRINDSYLEGILDEINPKSMSFEKLKETLTDALIEKFLWYYIEDPDSNGHMRISDYGLQPLVDLTSKLRSTDDLSRKVVLVDRMLNVIHQRSDIASWFVKGGSNALAYLSASPSERETEKKE